jgi:N,N'-diacetyllegionaminate synthase
MLKRTLIIAEAGVNHNGSFETAKKLIDVAFDAGADLVKFQTFSSSKLVTVSASKAEYQKTTTDERETQLNMLRRLELNEKTHSLLMEYCKQIGIGFFSTGFDTASVDLLYSLGLRLFKIPSGEITNRPYLEHIAKYGCPVIMSTGMATLGEIEAAIQVLEDTGLARDKVTVLHCTTEYPTPMQDVNLLAMCTIRDSFGLKVGYSDHTLGLEVAIAAVALGATVIEKHLTLDRKMTGPDHSASLEPGEFAAMVRCIRNLEMAMGDGIKRPSESEAKNRAVARKSLIASRAIKKGELFSQENVTTKRPGTGISPMRWNELLGRIAGRDFDPDELIEW